MIVEQWRLNNKCGFLFQLEKYEDEVLCDVAPMYTAHILLHRPCQSNRKVSYDGYKNHYSCEMNYRKVVLTPLKPLQAYEDQIRIAREYKLREKQKCEQEENKKESK